MLRFTIILGLTITILSGCQQEEQSSRYAMGDESLECDYPELYGEDCSGDHDSVEADAIKKKKKKKKSSSSKKKSSKSSKSSDDKDDKDEEEKDNNENDTPGGLDPQDYAQADNEVVFIIPANTGDSPWNTEATMVNVKVGEVLRIINMDSEVRQLHTGGDPFRHGGAINANDPANTDPKQAPQVAYPVESTIDPAGRNSPTTYDHIVGTSASFWIKATE